MKGLLWVILIIAFIACKENKKNEQTEKLSSPLQVDSVQIYYTTEWLGNTVIDTTTATDSVKNQFFLINRPSVRFDDIAFVKTKLPNIITVTDSILIKKFKYCFAFKDPKGIMSVTDCGLPIYRDLILLYADGKSIAQIKICFQCNQISIYPQEFSKLININDTTITRLEKYFKKNIHTIKRY